MKEQRTIHITPEMVGMDLFVFQADEIVETGITKIYWIRGRYLNEVAPAGSTAKWFRDELGQLWCKFDRTGSASVTNIVIPASSVVEVQYTKSCS